MDKGLHWVNQWQGEDVVCIASGPSLTVEQVEYVRGKARVIAVNDNYKLAPWADAIYACDHRWWSCHIDQARHTQAQLWSMDESACRDYGLRYVHAVRQDGFSTEAGVICHGTNSGYQAMNLAYQFGASRIILIGYDCQHTGGKRHWFGDHPKGWGNANMVSRWLQSYNSVVCPIPIINCTLDTALSFPMARLEDVL